MHYFKMWILTVALSANIPCGQSSLFFPSASAYGIFAAIAVPLDLPHRNVFVSYNFEANYNLPENYGIPKWATGIEDEDLFEEVARLDSAKPEAEDTIAEVKETYSEHTDNFTEARTKRSLPSLLTRVHFYHILFDKFERSGFESEPCLLRLICEVNSSELADVNGVLGSLMHIMFSPTTSRNENVPLKYYQAEVDGIHDQCDHYEETCPKSILDLISTPLHAIIDNILRFKQYNIIKYKTTIY